MPQGLGQFQIFANQEHTSRGKEHIRIWSLRKGRIRGSKMLTFKMFVAPRGFAYFIRFDRCAMLAILIDAYVHVQQLCSILHMLEVLVSELQ